MKRFYIPKSLLLLSIGLVPIAAKAQVPGFFKRMQLGYSFLTEKANYVRTYPVPNPGTLILDDSFRDTTVSTTISPSKSMGGFLGSYIRMAKLGKYSTLNFSIEANLSMLTWDNVPTENTTPDKTPGEVITGNTMAVGMPLGFDMKWGCDAYPDKGYKWCTGFGLGANAGSVNTTLNGASNNEIAVRPYIRAEVGALAGFCFKLRATYTFGKLQYISTDNSAPNSQGNIYPNITTLTSKSSFALSLVVMPFASTWDNSRWWK